MPSYANLSKCCKAPMLAKGDTTKFYVCLACSQATDRVRYPFKTKAEMTEFLDSRSYWTASTKLDKPKSCHRKNMPYLFAVMMFLLVGILIALAAR